VCRSSPLFERPINSCVFQTAPPMSDIRQEPHRRSGDQGYQSYAIIPGPYSGTERYERTAPKRGSARQDPAVPSRRVLPATLPGGRALYFGALRSTTARGPEIILEGWKQIVVAQSYSIPPRTCLRFLRARVESVTSGLILVVDVRLIHWQSLSRSPPAEMPSRGD